MKEKISKSLLRGPIGWMAGNSVASNLVMFLLLVGGVLFVLNIKQEIFPPHDLDRVNISVPYPGASPEEVEQGIVLSIEEAVQGLDGVKEVSSSANEGSGSVTVEIIEGEDLQKIANDIKSEVDRITTFPEDAEEPSVTIITPQRKVITAVIYGDLEHRVLREAAEEVRDTMLQDKEITQVTLSAVRDYEITIEVSQDVLRKYNLTIDGIAHCIE